MVSSEEGALSNKLVPTSQIVSTSIGLNYYGLVIALIVMLGAGGVSSEYESGNIVFTLPLAVEVLAM